MKPSSLLYGLFPLLIGAAQAEPAGCDSLSQCNAEGTQAYQAARYDAAAEAFERQLRRAEDADDDAARELALNNLVVTSLKLKQPGQARAWLDLALQAGMQGSATRHNLRSVAEAVDYPALQAGPEGHYLRYAGAAAWSSLDITRLSDGRYQAQFSPLRAGARFEEYGPAAIGELQGELLGSAHYFKLHNADLSQGCAVELLNEGLDIRVLEVFNAQCQQYGGAGISVAGRYLKVAAEPR